MTSHSNKLRIRRLKRHDAPVVSKLIKEIIERLGYYNERAKREELEKYTTSKIISLAIDDSNSVLVAYIDGMPVGFCISRYDDGLIWLDWFGVKKEYRYRGIGSSLLHSLIQTVKARRCHKIWCNSRVSNVKSKAVLQQAGFTKICEIKNHWYGQDFFLWERVI